MNEYDLYDKKPSQVIREMRRDGWVCEKHGVWVARKDDVVVRGVDAYQLAVRAQDVMLGLTPKGMVR